MQKIKLLMAVFALSAVAEGCKKRNEIPVEWRGRFRRTTAFGLVADQFVTAGANTLTVDNCQINCGESPVLLNTVNCTDSPYGVRCAYTSTHCTGVVTYSNNQMTITATPTPTTATGPALGTHNLTCSNIRLNMGARVQ